MTDLVLVLTAAPTRDAATALARSAVESRRAAGAQVLGPVISAFWHYGEFGTGEEWQVALQTSLDRYPELENHLIEQHPLDNPQIIAVPIAAAPAAYLAWARASTTG